MVESAAAVWQGFDWPVRYEGQAPYVDMAVTATDEIGFTSRAFAGAGGPDQIMEYHAGRQGREIRAMPTLPIAPVSWWLFATGDYWKPAAIWKNWWGHTPQSIAASRLSFYTRPER